MRGPDHLTPSLVIPIMIIHPKLSALHIKYDRVDIFMKGPITFFHFLCYGK